MHKHPEGIPFQTKPMNGNTPPIHPHPGETHRINRDVPNNQGRLYENPCRKKNNLKANIKIASMNLNGAMAPTENMSFLNKWRSISNTIQSEKITILVVQEMHLDQDMTEQLQTRFKKNLTIIVSEHLENPCVKAGVGFMINKKLIDPEEIKTYELIPGRAMVLEIKWLKTNTMSILNIYVPNERSTHTCYWADNRIKRHTLHIKTPDIVLGDFNVTEDAIDRMPPKLDDEKAIDALRETKQDWDLVDIWRKVNPTEKAFMYRAQTHSGHIQAHLDSVAAPSQPRIVLEGAQHLHAL